MVNIYELNIKKGRTIFLKEDGKKKPVKFLRFVGTNKTIIRHPSKGIITVSNKKLVFPENDSDEILTELDIKEGIRNRGHLPVQKYDVATRFEYLSFLIDMVVSERANSLIITGKGGIGKTFTALQRFEEAGIKRPDDWWLIKGFTTPKALYSTLKVQNGKLILFDDCDSAFKDRDGKNVLKGALDSYGERTVSWSTDNTVGAISPGTGEAGDASQFAFTGRGIFISNLERKNIDQPLLSRALTIDISLTVDEKLQWIEHNLLNLCKEDETITDEHRKRAFGLVEQNKEYCADINFRTVIKVMSVLATGKEKADDVAKFLLRS